MEGEDLCDIRLKFWHSSVSFFFWLNLVWRHDRRDGERPPTARPMKAPSCKRRTPDPHDDPGFVGQPGTLTAWRTSPRRVPRAGPSHWLPGRAQGWREPHGRPGRVFRLLLCRQARYGGTSFPSTRPENSSLRRKPRPHCSRTASSATASKPVWRPSPATRMAGAPPSNTCAMPCTSAWDSGSAMRMQTS